MSIRWAFNSATVMNCGWDEELKLWEKFGWTAAEIWYSKMQPRLATGATCEQLRRQMQDAGVLPIGVCAGSISTAFGARNREQEYSDLAKRLDVTATMGAPSLTVIIDGEAGDDLAQEYSDLIDPLRHVAEMADERGVRINLEFLGGLPINGTLGSGIELVSRVDHPALGLLFDLCHYYVSASHLEELELLPESKLFMVHVDDSPRMPMETLRNDQRCYPGDGRIPVVTLINHFRRRMKYDGYFSVELYDPNIWKLEAEQVMSQLNASLKKIEQRIESE